MENPSDTDSSEILGDWDLILPVNTKQRSEVARSNPPKDIETRVSEKERGSTSARRLLPPWMDPSYEWGGGKWKEDGRKKKKKEKESEEIIPFKQVIEALLGNSGEKVEEEKSQSQSCVDVLKSSGLKFP